MGRQLSRQDETGLLHPGGRGSGSWELSLPRVAARPTPVRRHPMFLAEITHVQTVAQNGIGIGSAIAIVCSWHRNRSILFAALAGLFSWLYVLYFALTRRPDERR